MVAAVAALLLNSGWSEGCCLSEGPGILSCARQRCGGRALELPPTTRRVVLLGAWAAVAFYWRADHGVYVALAVPIACLVAHGLRPAIVTRCLAGGRNDGGLGRAISRLCAGNVFSIFQDTFKPVLPPRRQDIYNTDTQRVAGASFLDQRRPYRARRVLRTDNRHSVDI